MKIHEEELIKLGEIGKEESLGRASTAAEAYRESESTHEMIDDIRAYAKVSLIVLSLISATNIVIAIKLVLS